MVKFQKGTTFMRYAFAITSAAAALALSACSENTQDNAETMVDRAAADTAANAEVVENTVREGTIEAADAVTQGAQNLKAELEQDEVDDPDQGDGALDGTD